MSVGLWSNSASPVSEKIANIETGPDKEKPQGAGESLPKYPYINQVQGNLIDH